MVADDAQLGGTLGRYAVQTLKAKTIAVIDDRTAYGQGVASEFEKAAKAAGATISKREFTNDKGVGRVTAGGVPPWRRGQHRA